MANDENIFSAKNIAQMKRGQTEYEKAIKGMKSGASDLQDALSKSPDEVNKILKSLGFTKTEMEGIITDVEKANKGFKISTDRAKDLEDIFSQVNETYTETNKVQEAHDAKQKELNDKMDEYLEGWYNFKAVVTDPKVAGGLFMVAAMANLKKMGDDLLEVSGTMGLTADQTLQVAGAAGKATIQGLAMGVGFKNSLDSAAALAEEMGDLNSLTSEAIKNVATMNSMLGVSHAEGAQLHKIFKEIGGGTDAAATNMTKMVENMARANKVAPGKVMSDIAKDTEGFAGYAKDGGKNVAEAAIYAKKLGVEFSTLTKMADDLLDIESSIEAEMNASVLLGKQINMNKARELALSGDLGGAMNEVLNQVGGINEWENMNVIQRKALADAAGLEMSEMQSILSNREKQIELGMVEATAGEKRMATIKGIGMTFKENIGMISATINMMASLLNTDWMSFYVKAKTWIGEKAHWAWKTATAGAYWVAEKVANTFTWVGSAASWIGEKAHWAWKTATTGGYWVAEKVANLFTWGGNSSNWAAEVAHWGWKNTTAVAFWIKEKAHALYMKAFGGKKGGGGGEDLTKSAIPKDTPKANDMGAGKMGGNMKNIVMGAAAMVLVAAAVFVFAKAVQEFMNVSWEAVGMAVVSMLALVGAVALLGAIMMSGVGAVAIIAGAAAMLIVAAAVLVLAFALKIMSQAIPNFMLLIPMLPQLAIGMIMMYPAIPAMFMMGMALPFLGFGLAAAAVGLFLFTMAGGAEAILMLGEALVPLAAAAPGLALAAIGMVLFGLSLYPMSLGLMMLTFGLPSLFLLGMILPLVTPHLAALGEAGPGLILAGLGFAALGIGSIGLIAFAFALFFLNFGIPALLALGLVLPLVVPHLIALGEASSTLAGVGLSLASLALAAPGLMLFAGAMMFMLFAIPSMMLLSLILPILVPHLVALGAIGASLMLVGPALALLGASLVPLAVGLLAFAGSLFFFTLFGGFKALNRMAEVFTKIGDSAQNISLLGPALNELAIAIPVLAEVSDQMNVVGDGIKKLGTAIGVAGVGIGIFNTAGGTNTVRQLGESIPRLATQAPMIIMLSMAFSSLAKSLKELATGLLFMLPALPILGLLAIAVPALKAISGLGGGKAAEEAETEEEEEPVNEPGNQAVIDKLDELISAVQAGGIINMDGKKVGDVIGLAATPRRT